MPLTVCQSAAWFLRSKGAGEKAHRPKPKLTKPARNMQGSSVNKRPTEAGHIADSKSAMLLIILVSPALQKRAGADPKGGGSDGD